ADHGGHKKRFLAFTTTGCVLFTAMLGTVGPGDTAYGIMLVVLAGLMFASGENFIAAFLPEIARQQDMGRISGYGWSLGYLGGLLVLALCLGYIEWGRAQGQTAAQYVPPTMWITAAMFALASLPTFVWLHERARPQGLAAGESYIRIGFRRVADTFKHVRRYRDLFRFLVTLAVYYCGINAVIVLAAVYAQQVMGFSARDNIFLILVVNVTAAIGAFGFGLLQDRLGSVKTLAATLIVWIAALGTAYFVESRAGFWVVANLVGISLGSSQSAGRALVGQFSPPGRSAEFFGLWGLAGKLAAVVGPLTYGAITYLSGGDHRMALLSTTVFFIVGFMLLLAVDEQRGRRVAHET
ncbi:MAG TPA: MFS transporter, partial [Burkholderiales bacterium]|nr:MFS transporter [Burkholderiales bacterium]